ncbi:terminase small subunit [Peribacillus sp. SCS-155]|uniref:terminase small subunit n=1 Tax=Peribacillus sedimenti TaxID=3115297 RepID=UPI0039065ECC
MTLLNDNDHKYNDKELLFCQFYVKTQNGTLSAIQAGYSENSAHVTASRMLKTEKIQALISSIRNETTEALRAQFLSDAFVARQIMYDIMNDSEVTPTIRLQAAKDFLDRAGFKAVEKKELTENRTINVEFNIPRPTHKN